MAHPYAGHRQSAVEHSRVKHIAKGYVSGGAVIKTEDDRKVRKMSASQEREVNPEGGVAAHRMDRPKRAKGGRVKGNAKTIINVINGGDKAAPPPMPPMGIAPPGAMPPPAPPMAAKPPMPMLPPGGPPPGMPMRAKGGRVNQGSPVYEEGKRNGTQVSHTSGKSDLADMNRKTVVTFASGGRVRRFEASNAVSPASKLPGGGGGGEARLAKAHRAARK